MWCRETHVCSITECGNRFRTESITQLCQLCFYFVSLQEVDKACDQPWHGTIRRMLWLIRVWRGSATQYDGKRVDSKEAVENDVNR